MWYMHDGMSWWMIFGGAWMFIFWGGVIALIVWGIARLTRGSSSISRHAPLDTARERYAKGEITRKEFEQIKEDLS